MMVKKKKNDHEEPVHKPSDETADNKDNKYLQEITETDNAERSSSEEIMNTPAESWSNDESSSDEVVSPEQDLLQKLADLQDKYLRLSAEFDNYRKRTLREKIELSKYSTEYLLLKILPVMDDFERALSQMEISSDCVATKNGIDLIYLKFADFLKQSGVREIESLNCPFNVDLHDAVAKVQVQQEDKKGKVVEVLLKGYYLNDKVIRHSKVVVGE